MEPRPYICDKHDFISARALEIQRLAAACGQEDIADLAALIEEEVVRAKQDGVSMENALVRRAVQADAMTDLAQGFLNLGSALQQALNPPSTHGNNNSNLSRRLQHPLRLD